MPHLQSRSGHLLSRAGHLLTDCGCCGDCPCPPGVAGTYLLSFHYKITIPAGVPGVDPLVCENDLAVTISVSAPCAWSLPGPVDTGCAYNPAAAGGPTPIQVLSSLGAVLYLAPAAGGVVAGAPACSWQLQFTDTFGNDYRGYRNPKGTSPAGAYPDVTAVQTDGITTEYTAVSIS